jgi:hypothetical protein
MWQRRHGCFLQLMLGVVKILRALAVTNSEGVNWNHDKFTKGPIRARALVQLLWVTGYVFKLVQLDLCTL